MGLFSKGTLELQLNKFNFKPGEMVEGTVKLKLKKPAEGKELWVKVVGKKITNTQSSSGALSSSHHHSSSTSSQKIFDFKIPLGGQQTYSEGEYPFQIMLPADVLFAADKKGGADMPDGMKTAMSAIAVVAGSRSTSSRLKWVVHAELDMPGMDLRKKQDITVTE